MSALKNSYQASDTLDAPFADYYAEHLAKVNETQDVISTADIANENGVLLCKKGTRINKETAAKLIQHRLTQPIEDSIKLSKSIDNAFLYTRLLSIFEQYPDFKTIHRQQNFTDIGKQAFVSALLPPLIIQKLSVINERISEQIDKAIFCAWISSLMVTELGLDKDQMHAAFHAGLLHDIGFVHLSPALLNKKEVLSDAEWRAIQSHVVIGKLMLEKCDDVSPSVAIAVFEHHERCDGNGYPFNKNANNLSILGQVVGIADSIYAIRTLHFEPHGRTLIDLLPYLKMNENTYFSDVLKALSNILKRTDLKVALPKANNASRLANTLLMRCQALGHTIAGIHENRVVELCGELSCDKGKALFMITQHVLKMTAQSGLVKEEIRIWLKNIINDPDLDKATLAELNEIDLMLSELHWQLKYTYLSCSNLLDGAGVSASTMYKLREAYNSVALCLGDLEDKL